MAPLVVVVAGKVKKNEQILAFYDKCMRQPNNSARPSLHID